MNLNEQQLFLRHILKVYPAKVINFCRKALILCLPNKSNLYYWKITEDNQCFFCHHMQVQLHALSNCKKMLE